MTNTSKTAAKTAPAMKQAPDADKLSPTSFANIEALLASRPNTAENCQQRSHGAAYSSGQDTMAMLAASFSAHEGTPMPLDERAAQTAMKGRDILLERVIGAMTGNYGYSLAYANAASDRLRDFLGTEERDRDAVAGFASKCEQLMEAAMERDAQTAWLCDVIQGATEAFLDITGSPYKLYVASSRAKEVERTDEQKKLVADNMAKFLASRRG